MQNAINFEILATIAKKGGPLPLPTSFSSNTPAKNTKNNKPPRLHTQHTTGKHISMWDFINKGAYFQIFLLYNGEKLVF